MLCVQYVDVITTPTEAISALSHLQEFWDSLIIGTASSRDTVRVAADCAMNGDYENCNAILASVDFRTNGTLAVVWDARGVQYTLPPYTFSRPRNVISKEEATAMMRKVVAHKGPVSDVPVTLRLSSTLRTLEQDIPVTLRSDETAAQVKQRLHDMLCSGQWDKKDNTSNVWQSDMCEPSAQRLMYDGRELVDEQHMQQARVRPGSYLQVFLRMPLKGGA